METDSLYDKLFTFTSLCHLLIFCSIVHRRYVGTSDFDHSQIITDVERELTRLKLEFRVRNQPRTLTRNDLYRRYQDYVPPLPDDANESSFHPVVLFLNALHIHLKILVVARGYQLANFSALSTKMLQHNELEVIRESTVAAQRSMEEETKQIRAMITSVAPSHNAGNTFNVSSTNISP